MPILNLFLKRSLYYLFCFKSLRLIVIRQENGRVVGASPGSFQLDPLICLYTLFYASLGLARDYISNIIFKNYNISFYYNSYNIFYNYNIYIKILKFKI